MMYKYQYNLPSPPFIEVEGISNFRDIGGYPVQSPSDSPGGRATRSIRRGLIFRSGEPTRLTRSGMQKLQSMGVTTIFDLRSAAEALKDVHAIIESDGSRIERISAPIFAAEDDEDDDDEEEEDERDVRRGKKEVSQTQKTHEAADTNTKTSAAYKRCAAHMHSGVDGTSNGYREILHHAGRALRTILLHLQRNPSDPILLHCKLGRDRTGVIIALLLSLAGVSDDIIAKEYQLTEVGLGPMREEIVADVLGRERDGEEVTRKKIECLVGAREKNCRDLMNVLRREFGSAEGFVREKCGFVSEDVDAVRRMLVVDVAPCHYAGGVVVV